MLAITRDDLGHFDDESCRLEPLPNPFAAKLLDPATAYANAPLAKPIA
jgi:hypothetical protein